MNKFFYFCIFYLITGFFTREAVAQKAITGIVKDRSTNKALSGVTIQFIKSGYSVQTKGGGIFSYTEGRNTPLMAKFTLDGYNTVEKELLPSEKEVVVYLQPVLQAPLSVRHLNSQNIVYSASPSFYDAIANMPGVGVSTQSFLYTSLNTRGFNTIANSRFSQYVDGMENQAPGLNFPIGNMLGIADLDVEQVDMFPVNSPQLNGEGGMNGALLINSKSPFTQPGLSAQYRVGLNHVDNYQSKRSPWEDMSVRYGRAINSRLGVKVVVSYTQGQDWESRNARSFDRINMHGTQGDRSTDAAYDGINVYGDEPTPKTPTLQQIGANIKEEYKDIPCHCLPEPQRSIVTAFNRGLLPKLAVTRTGYAEQDLLDYKSNSLKTSGAVHYKLSNSIEAIAQVNWRKGNTSYTDVDRYSLKDFSLGQYKLELRGSEFFLRGYTTQVRSGDSYNATLLGGMINESWKPTSAWLNDYIAAFASARVKGVAEQDAHNSSRATADKGRPDVGSAEYGALKTSILNTSSRRGGAKLQDRSALYHYEGAYDFSDLLKNEVELLFGGSYRKYNVNSNTTIFDNPAKNISLHEIGTYIQLGKNITKNFRLKGSIRLDQSENFQPVYSPGLTGAYSIRPNQEIKASYRMRFRNPNLQNQYLDFSAANGGIHLLGGLPEMLNKYNLYSNRPFTAESYKGYVTNGGTLEEYTFDSEGIKPERVQAFDIDYHNLINNKLVFNAFSYYNLYNNYISAIDVYQTSVPANLSAQNISRYNVPVNVPGKLTSWGGGLGLGYELRKITLNGNIAYNNSDNLPVNFNEGFNMPRVLFNAGVSSREVLKNVGFNFVYRWQDAFYWQSSFVSGKVPAFGSLDGQLSFKLPAYNSIIKVGGSNLLNQYYNTSLGNPLVGGMYYVSVIFNEIMP